MVGFVLDPDFEETKSFSFSFCVCVGFFDLSLHKVKRKERRSVVLGITNQESSGFWFLRENEFCRRKGDMKSGIIVGLEVQ